MAPLGTVVFFTVVAFVAAVCWYKWGLVGGSSSLEAHLAPAAGLSCSVSWQPISSPVEPQKRWEAACLGRLMEQTVPAGTCALVTGVLSREGRNDYWLGGIRHIPFIIQKQYFGWTNTFQLDCSRLGQPPTGPVTRSKKSWKGCVRPMKQTEPGTCTIVSCTEAVEAMHCKVFEEKHSAESKKFPDDWKAAKDWPGQLRRACERKGIWKSESGGGASVGDVLTKIQELGGVRTTLAEGLMPLREWEEHSDSLTLTPELVAALVDQGPCVGRLWTCPWYSCFKATNNWVYRGCGRDQGLRDECKRLYDGQVMGSHAVLCLEYRILANGEMHVLVSDNHDDNGPERWIHVEEFDAIFTLKVDCLTPLAGMTKVLLLVT